MKLPQREQGMTLLMSLIMLVVLTLLALSSFNLTQANMQVVTNMQQRDAVSFAARGVIDEVLSSKAFHENATQTLAQQAGCGGLPDQRCLDTNGDNVNDVTVKVASKPKCVKVKTIKTSDLNQNDPEEAKCSLPSGNFGVAGGGGNGDSMCADSVWEVQVEAVDDISKAKMTVTQGIGVRVAMDDIKTKCPD
jgi:hypothetical protein